MRGIFFAIVFRLIITKLNRRFKTLIYLLGATILSGVGSLFEHTFLYILAGFACILFGLGMVISNYAYRRHFLSTLATIISFIIIFIWGTLPFYSLGDMIYDRFLLFTPNYAPFAFGMFGGFLLCFVTVIIWYKGIVINWLAILMLLASPFIVFEIVQIPWFSFERGTAKQFSTSVIIFQTLLTLIIVASIKSETKNLHLTDESAV